VIFLVPSPPSDLAVDLRFIDYKPIVTITWNVSVYRHNIVCTCVECVCLCVCVCARMHTYAFAERMLN